MLPTINTALLAVRIDQFHDVVLGTVDSFTVAKDEVLWLRCRIWSPPRNQQAWMDHSASLCNTGHVFVFWFVVSNRRANVIPVSPHPMAAKLPCSKRIVSSQPPATQLFSTAINGAPCSAWFDPSQSQGTWKCGHVMHKAKRRKSTSWRVCWTCFVASFTDFSRIHAIPCHSCLPCTSDRFVSNLHSCIRWNSGGWVSSRVSLSKEKNIHGIIWLFFCKATRHGLRSFMKDKKKVSHFIKLSYLLLKFVEEENLLWCDGHLNPW